MILDSVFNIALKEIGKEIVEEKLSNKQLENIEDLFEIFNTIKKGLENKEIKYGLLGYIFYNFISSIEARKRKVTSRNVEDLLAYFLGGSVRDETTRENPTVPQNIKELDSLCENETWKISDDLATNKREKDDIKILNYTISIKTLVGSTYGKEGNLINNKDCNNELNVGSVSYRALLKGILDDDELQKLSDRKGGLGSKAQLKNSIFNKLTSEKKEIFIKRLLLFFEFLYSDDFFILLKENFRIRIILFTGEGFRLALKKAWDEDLDEFLSIFYRWENNNLRIMWQKLLPYLPKKLEVILPLHLVYSEFDIDSTITKIKTTIISEMKKEGLF